MLQMMIPLKQTLKLSALILNMVMLVACGVATTAPNITMPATTAPSLTPVISTPTISSATSSPTSTSSLPVSSAPNGLRMVYVVGGNLYLQEGNQPPVQLTHSEQDGAPHLSYDGEKIAFFRGKIPLDLYSINVDGSQEQALVTTSKLITLDLGYDESTTFYGPTFVPGTHLLLFSTYEFHPDTSTWNGDLLVVDTDTGEIKQLLSHGQAGGFYVSPDGNLIAIDVKGHIDVINLSGQFLRHNLAIYTLSQPITLAPIIYWTPDSTELTVLLPIETSYDTSKPPSYTLWRYGLDGKAGTQILLNPSPMGNDIAKVSFDGNWIIYDNYEQGAFYVGDLREGRTQLYEKSPGVSSYEWSPDSTYFIFGMYQPDGEGLYLGSVNSLPIFIGKGNFIGWIDKNRYLYYFDNTIVMGEIGGATIPILSGVNEFFSDNSVFNFIFMYR